MHDSVMEFARRVLTKEEVYGKRVLEVGSNNVNGSVSYFIKGFKPSLYTGIDAEPGPCVDIAMDWTKGYYPGDLIVDPFQETAEIVISTEMLEHAYHWQTAVHRMKRAVAKGGVIIVTTRSHGFPYHNPPDYWRFSVEDFSLIFNDFDIQILMSDPQVPGVFIKAQRRPLRRRPLMSLQKLRTIYVERTETHVPEKLTAPWRSTYVRPKTNHKERTAAMAGRD